ncbi:MAG: DUF4055 domain-containing protein [Planctomycetota bacterium JB042]
MTDGPGTFAETGSGRKDTPFSPSVRWEGMQDDIELAEDLCAGTGAMRGRIRRISGEKDEHYAQRVDRAVLTEFFRGAIDTLSGLPFQQDVTIEGLPPALDYLRSDMDGRGRSAATVAYETLRNILKHGLGHLLSSRDGVPTNDARLAGSTDRVATRLEELRARVYVAPVSANELRAWHHDEETGDLDEFRIVGSRLIREDGKRWTDKEQPTVTVYELEPGGVGVVSTFVEDKTAEDGYAILGTPKPFDSGLDEAPLVTVYGGQTGEMTARSILAPLAELNLAHFLSDVDQRHALRIARYALLCMFGVKEDDLDVDVHIAPVAVYKFKKGRNESGMEFVETTGAALEAGANSLRHDEERMEVLRGQPLARESAAKTATGANIDENRGLSALQSIIRAVNKGMEAAIRQAITWAGLPQPPEEGDGALRVVLFSDFKSSNLELAKVFIDAAVALGLPKRSVLEGMQRFGLLPGDEDLDAILAEIEKADADEADRAFREAAALAAARGKLGPPQQDDGADDGPPREE